MLTEARRLQMLRIPTGKVDMVLDTDTYNEVDDQFALAFLIRSAEQVSLRAVYAAPFHAQPFFPAPLIRWRSESPEDGMERSYEEILHIIALCGGDFPGQVKKGSRRFLPDRHTPVTSPAALDLAATELIEWCSPEGGGSHPIWDVCAAAWPMNQGERFMTGCLVPTPGITADRRYIPRRDAPVMHYVEQIRREALYGRLFTALAGI